MITRRAFATMLMGALSTIWIPVPDDDKPPVVVAKENQKARDHAAIHSRWKEWKFDKPQHIVCKAEDFHIAKRILDSRRIT